MKITKINEAPIKLAKTNFLSYSKEKKSSVVEVPSLLVTTGTASAIAAYAMSRPPEIQNNKLKQYNRQEIKVLNKVKETAGDYYNLIMESPADIKKLSVISPNNDNKKTYFISTEGSNLKTGLQIYEDKDNGITEIHARYISGETSIFVDTKSIDDKGNYEYKVGVTQKNASSETKRIVDNIENLHFIPKNNPDIINCLNSLSKIHDSSYDKKNIQFYEFHPGLYLSENYNFIRNHAKSYYNTFMESDKTTKIETNTRSLNNMTVHTASTENSDVKTKLQIVEDMSGVIDSIKTNYSYPDGKVISISGSYDKTKERYICEVSISLGNEELYHSKGYIKNIYKLGFTPHNCDEVKRGLNKINKDSK